MTTWSIWPDWSVGKNRPPPRVSPTYFPAVISFSTRTEMPSSKLSLTLWVHQRLRAQPIQPQKVKSFHLLRRPEQDKGRYYSPTGFLQVPTHCSASRAFPFKYLPRRHQCKKEFSLPSVTLLL